MGNNDYGEIFAEQIIKTYNANLLTPKLIKILYSPFQYTDINFADEYETAEDGKTFEEVIVYMIEPNFPPSCNVYDTGKHIDNCNEDIHDEDIQSKIRDAFYDKFYEILNGK